MTLTHNAFISWLDENKEAINTLLTPSLVITHEYNPDAECKSLLMDADVGLGFKVAEQDLKVYIPVFASFKLNGEQLLLDITSRDNFNAEACYSELMVDFDQDESTLDENEWFEKIDTAFFEYYCLEKIPNWNEKLLSSISHDEIIAQLKALDSLYQH